MKKISVILSLLTLSVTLSFAQFERNKVDSNGQKQGSWEETKPNGDLMKGWYKDGKKSGAWATFQKNGKVSLVESYVDGKKNGIFIEFDNNSFQAGVEFYKDDLLDGVSTKYQGNRIISEISYVNGKEHGKKKLYYSTGKKQEESNMIYGLKEGVSTWYDENEKVIAEYNYSKGEFHGEQKTFYSSGIIRTKETYNNGKQTGESIEYFEDGAVKKKGNYNKEGLKDGEWVEFDQTGKKIKIEKYKAGKLQ